MATLGGIYIFVKDEECLDGVDSVTHPVESGCDITDHVKQKAVTLAVSGKIVGENAEKNREQLLSAMKKGSLLQYIGRNVLSNMQILSFKTTHSKDVWGGFDYDMTLQQVRVAKSAYSAPVSSGGTNAANASAAVKAGDILKLTNEPLYVSSTAKNASTKVTGTYYVYDGQVIKNRIRITNSASRVGKTPVGMNVTGWISSSARGTGTSGTTNAGTQQVTENSTSGKVYHTVKSGDTVWGLVSSSNAPYKKYGFSCNDVMKNNPDAFSRQGDFGTLKTGVKLWVGNR